MVLHILKGHGHIQGSANTSEWTTSGELGMRCRSRIKGENEPKGALQALRLVIKGRELRIMVNLILCLGPMKQTN